MTAVAVKIGNAVAATAIAIAVGVPIFVTTAEQTQDSVNATHASEIASLRRDVDVLQEGRLSERVAVVENWVDETRTVGRSIILLVAGQLVVSLWHLKKRRGENGNDGL